MLVLAYLRMESEPAPVPDAVRIVTSRMVARIFERDATPGVVPEAQSVTQQSGPFGRTVAYRQGVTSGGPWLAATDKTLLKALRVDGMTSVGISSGRTGGYRTEGAP